MKVIDINNLENVTLKDPQWFLTYWTIDAGVAWRTKLNAKFPGLPIFGASSFHGVLTPEGFKRGAYALVGEAEDEISVEVVIAEHASDLRERAKKAAMELQAKISGRAPECILLHAAPGAEERILEGIADVFGASIPIFGGSAADDDVSGKWQVFSGFTAHSNGFVMAAFCPAGRVHGEFLGGYLPSRHHGTITEAQGRVVLTIDNRPAAEVYDEWTGGALGPALRQGGVVLGETSMAPVGRVLKRVFGIPIFLLSHPHEVIPETRALAFFSEFFEGDEITLMRGSEKALVTRTELAVSRALNTDKRQLKGSVLVYCGGCVGAIEHAMDEVCASYLQSINGAPFLGIASFGEQGKAHGAEESRHGNLMCSVMLFE